MPEGKPNDWNPTVGRYLIISCGMSCCLWRFRLFSTLGWVFTPHQSRLNSMQHYSETDFSLHGVIFFWVWFAIQVPLIYTYLSTEEFTMKNHHSVLQSTIPSLVHWSFWEKRNHCFYPQQKRVSIPDWLAPKWPPVESLN